jgi:hypothetical protein
MAFGGPQRDRLLMTASQSLFLPQVAVQATTPGQRGGVQSTASDSRARVRAASSRRAWKPQ